MINNVFESTWSEAAMLHLMYYTGFWMEGLNKTMISVITEDLNPRPPEYEAGLRTSRP
jgi:hypothetical protein